MSSDRDPFKCLSLQVPSQGPKWNKPFLPESLPMALPEILSPSTAVSFGVGPCLDCEPLGAEEVSSIILSLLMASCKRGREGASECVLTKLSPGASQVLPLWGPVVWLWRCLVTVRMAS